MSRAIPGYNGPTERIVLTLPEAELREYERIAAELNAVPRGPRARQVTVQDLARWSLARFKSELHKAPEAFLASLETKTPTP